MSRGVHEVAFNMGVVFVLLLVVRWKLADMQVRTYTARQVEL